MTFKWNKNYTIRFVMTHRKKWCNWFCKHVILKCHPICNREREGNLEKSGILTPYRFPVWLFCLKNKRNQ